MLASQERGQHAHLRADRTA